MPKIGISIAKKIHQNHNWFKWLKMKKKSLSTMNGYGERALIKSVFLKEQTNT